MTERTRDAMVLYYRVDILHVLRLAGNCTANRDETSD